MNPSLNLDSQWISWKSANKTSSIYPTVTMVGNNIRDKGETSIYFVIMPPKSIEPSKLAFNKPLEFLIYVDKGVLTYDTKSDFTGRCIDYPSCTWAKEFGKFMESLDTEVEDLGIVLTEALNIYKKLLFGC